jgi:hypothetical protein
VTPTASSWERSTRPPQRMCACTPRRHGGEGVSAPDDDAGIQSGSTGSAARSTTPSIRSPQPAAGVRDAQPGHPHRPGTRPSACVRQKAKGFGARRFLLPFAFCLTQGSPGSAGRGRRGTRAALGDLAHLERGQGCDSSSRSGTGGVERLVRFGGAAERTLIQAHYSPSWTVPGPPPDRAIVTATNKAVKCGTRALFLLCNAMRIG